MSSKETGRLSFRYALDLLVGFSALLPCWRKDLGQRTMPEVGLRWVLTDATLVATGPILRQSKDGNREHIEKLLVLMLSEERLFMISDLNCLTTRLAGGNT